MGFDEIGAEAEDYNGEEYLCGMCVSLLEVVELWSVRRTCRARRPTLMMLTIVSYCRGLYYVCVVGSRWSVDVDVEVVCTYGCEVATGKQVGNWVREASALLSAKRAS